VLHDVTPHLAVDFSASSRSIAPTAMPHQGDQRRSASAASPIDSKRSPGDANPRFWTAGGSCCLQRRSAPRLRSVKENCSLDSGK
jgi:hypothetical protein